MNMISKLSKSLKQFKDNDLKKYIRKLCIDHIVSPYDSLIKKNQPDIQYEAHVAPLVTIGCCLACAICEF